MGGRDIDEALVEYCIKEFQEEKNIDLSESKEARKRLAIECERVKVILSEQHSAEALVASIVVNVVNEDEEVYEDLEVSISRDTLESELEQFNERLEACLEKVIEDAAMEKDEIDKILLVGGSSRIPKIK